MLPAPSSVIHFRTVLAGRRAIPQQEILITYMNNLYFTIVNYTAPDIRTFPNLSIPPMEHVYLQRELTDRSEISIEKGIQEMEIIEKHENLRELYSIQQSIYGNTAYLYRLLYDILSLLEKAFNQNSYIPSGGYHEDVKCHRLFRPQFRKVNPSFVARIP